MWISILFLVLGGVTLHPVVSGGIALTLGLFFGVLLGNPHSIAVRKWTPVLLQVSVVGLGASMNLMTVASVGLHGAAYTTLGIILTLVLGSTLGRLLKLSHVTTVLLSAGTAICGGSAIAAVAPVIRAKDHEVSISLATVFFLNATALFLFPWIGHFFGLSETQFGLWSALAIHDTSSVVGAALQYGPRALEVATTVKLARALWIVPMTLIIGFLWKKDGNEAGSLKAKKPWFILGFILMAALMTWVPVLSPVGGVISQVAKRTLVLTLFLIGSGLSRATLQAVGIRPFVMGVALWILVGSSSFVAVFNRWID